MSAKTQGRCSWLNGLKIPSSDLEKNYKMTRREKNREKNLALGTNMLNRAFIVTPKNVMCDNNKNSLHNIVKYCLYDIFRF